MREDSMPPSKNVHLRVPPELVTAIEAAARAENKTPDEWAAEAFARHLESQKWQKLVAFGHKNSPETRL
jgi:predicted HicB family RNase H-like nuclease